MAKPQAISHTVRVSVHQTGSKLVSWILTSAGHVAKPLSKSSLELTNLTWTIHK